MSISPVELLLGASLATCGLVSTLLRGAISLLAIFSRPDRAARAEKVLRILHGQPDEQLGGAAIEEPAVDIERHHDDT
jgi:hypothetical protein